MKTMAQVRVGDSTSMWLTNTAPQAASLVLNTMISAIRYKRMLLLATALCCHAMQQNPATEALDKKDREGASKAIGW
jgi:hypothetical protein